MTLTEFLTARLDEDEATARETLPAFRGLISTTAVEGHIARHDPARVLREVEAKRAIVERYTVLRAEASRLHYAGADKGLIDTARNMYAGLELALRDLAAVYADHPDYDEAWRTVTD